MDTHARGLRYENAACVHLIDRGWAVLERNVRFGRKEIDLVVRRGRVTAFVEVKGRLGGDFGDPLDAITARKRREIETVAAWWMARHGRADGDVLYRFDAVAVRDRGGGRLEIEHVEDAWRPGFG